MYRHSSFVNHSLLVFKAYAAIPEFGSNRGFASSTRFLNVKYLHHLKEAKAPFCLKPWWKVWEFRKKYIWFIGFTNLIYDNQVCLFLEKRNSVSSYVPEAAF